MYGRRNGSDWARLYAPHRTVTLAAILPIPSAERVAGRWDGSDGARPTGYCRKKEAGSRRHKSLYGTSLMQSTRAGHVYMSVYRRTVCAAVSLRG
jgi:hypothetical protein